MTAGATDVMEGAQDLAALAQGGRTNIMGFLIRLAARLPFLFVAGRLYGAAVLGRFAYAVLIVEFAAQLATLGLRRGLASELARGDRPARDCVYDALTISALASLGGVVLLGTFPHLMFPNSAINGLDRLLALIVMPIAATDVLLAALAYRYNIAATVRARAVVEPWTISIASALFYLYSARDGLILSYVTAMLAALVAAVVPFVKSYGAGAGWRPRVATLSRLAHTNVPLAAADAIEWGSRRLDLAILGLFAGPAVVGVYYVAQQVASIPQKLKTSFDPILGPVITRNLGNRNFAAIARQIGQVGFWIIAAQLALALALGIPARGVMGLVGRSFVDGSGALIFLLMAEVAAATAVVSEAVLVYIAPRRNLVISLATFALQAGFSVAFLVIARHAGWRTIGVAAMPALALALSLATASFIKSRTLTRRLGARVQPWRWGLALASMAGGVVGAMFSWLSPEWVELALGVPMILASYGTVLWFRAFGADDRLLILGVRMRRAGPPGVGRPARDGRV